MGLKDCMYSISSDSGLENALVHSIGTHSRAVAKLACCNCVHFVEFYCSKGHNLVLQINTGIQCTTIGSQIVEYVTHNVTNRCYK